MLWLLLAAVVADDARPPRETGWSPRHPVALGLRGLVWGGEYVAPGVGGHVRLRPWRRLGVELFADHTHRDADDAHVYDNVIGFHAFVPLLGARRVYLAPTLGACVDFRVLDPHGDGPNAAPAPAMRPSTNRASPMSPLHRRLADPPRWRPADHQGGDGPNHHRHCRQAVDALVHRAA